MSPDRNNGAHPLHIEALQINRTSRFGVLRHLLVMCAVVALSLPITALAVDAYQRATVTRVVSEETTDIPGTGVQGFLQLIEVRLHSGEVVAIENDRIRLAQGDSLFVSRVEGTSTTIYNVIEPDRRVALVAAVVLFAVVTALVGRWVGVRALIALFSSLALIIFLLLPVLIRGAPPVAASLATATAILAIVMGITHGLARATVAAFIASLVTVVIAVSLGDAFVRLAHLSGFADDASVYLNLTTGGTLDMVGIFLGALVIGTLGIVDDLAVTQVLTVAELRAANGTLSRRELYHRAMKVGREHLGAVINTLVLAYTGAALPLLMLASASASSPGFLVNSEVVAVEIIRSAVSGIALALVLPLATLLGLFSLGRESGQA